jgi:hypothetical protein
VQRPPPAIDAGGVFFVVLAVLRRPNNGFAAPSFTQLPAWAAKWKGRIAEARESVGAWRARKAEARAFGRALRKNAENSSLRVGPAGSEFTPGEIWRRPDLPVDGRLSSTGSTEITMRA